MESVLNDLNMLQQFITYEDGLERPEVQRDSKAIYEQHCATCHNLHANSQIGPHLNGLFNRTVGSADDYNYSSVLRRDNRKWTPELLESFLKNPDDEFNGNRMQQIQLTQAENRQYRTHLKNRNQW